MGDLWDMAVIGCGPAGLSAAVNGKIRNKNILLLGVELCSPKMHKSPFIFNYLGFSKVTGEDLRQAFLKHVDDMEITMTTRKADTVYAMGDEFSIVCGTTTFRAKSVIMAAGINYGRSLKGENEFLGKGVGYCATCDAPLYKGKTVALIGYNADGEEESNFLSEVCGKVYYIPVYKDVGSLSDNVEIINKKPVEILGDKKVTHLAFEDSSLEVEGVFIIKDTVPVGQLVPGLEMDGAHIKVDRSMKTNIEGLYAAGDCAGKPYQLAKAVGEGQIAALHAVEYIDKKY